MLLPAALSPHAHAHWRGGVWVGVGPAVPYYAPPPVLYAPPPPTFSWEAPPPVIGALPPPLTYPPPLAYPSYPYPYPAPVPRVWVPPRWTGWGWVPGHWRQEPNGWMWVEGHWD